jgi:hypothetical protein
MIALTDTFRSEMGRCKAMMKILGSAETRLMISLAKIAVRQS